MVMKPDIEIRHYGTRNWAVHEGRELFAVTVYKKGALAIQGALAIRRAARDAPRGGAGKCLGGLIDSHLRESGKNARLSKRG